MSAQQIVRVYMDLLKDSGVPHRPAMLAGRMGRAAKLLLAEGIKEEVIIEGVRTMLSRGYVDPSLLDSFVTEVAVKKGQQGASDPLSQLLAKHNGRWPTGTRLSRGSHGTTYVRDPLGYEWPQHEVPWGRPSRKEVIHALRSRGGP